MGRSKNDRWLALDDLIGIVSRRCVVYDAAVACQAIRCRIATTAANLQLSLNDDTYRGIQRNKPGRPTESSASVHTQLLFTRNR